MLEEVTNVFSIMEHVISVTYNNAAANNTMVDELEFSLPNFEGLKDAHTALHT